MPRLFYDTADPTRLRASLESLETYVDERDRKRWIPAGAFEDSAGAAYATIASAATTYTGLSMPDAATTPCTATLNVPSTWANGTLSVSAVVGNNSAGAGNVLMQMRLATAPAATALSDTIVYSAAVAAPAQNQLKVISSTATHAVDANDVLILLKVSRVGGDAGDTLAGTLVFFGALVTYNP